MAAVNATLRVRFGVEMSERLRLKVTASALLLLVASLAGCDRAEPAATSGRAPLVEAVEARLGKLPLEEVVPGVVRAENQVVVRPEISAQVAEVLVRSGQAVDRGQVLVRLRDEELREQLRRAEAEVRLAEATAAEARARAAEIQFRADRLKRLAEDDLVSPLEMESASAQLEAVRAAAQAAEAGVEQSRAVAEERTSALGKTLVRSPVAGRVGERRVEVGMQVSPDTPLFRAGNLQRLTVEVELTEETLGGVRQGQQVIVRPRGVGSEAIGATLDRVSPFLAEESFTAVGEIDLDNTGGRLRPGMFVTVRILYGRTAETTLIPTSALWEHPRTGERGVFVVIDADGLEVTAAGVADNPEQSRRVSFRRVQVVAEGRGSVGIDGIAAGEWVVIAGQHLLLRAMQGTSPESGLGSTPARIRPTSWERVSALQDLQREDLLKGFLDKQRRVARALGAEIPESESVVKRALETQDEPAEAGVR